MSLDSLYPFANQHAIQNALFALEWKDRLTEKDIRDLKVRIQQRHAAFTVFKPQKMVVLNLTTGAADGTSPESSASENGFVFELPGELMQPARRTLNIQPRFFAAFFRRRTVEIPQPWSSCSQLQTSPT